MSVMITIINNNHDNVGDEYDVMITMKIITMIMLEMITM